MGSNEWSFGEARALVLVLAGLALGRCAPAPHPAPLAGAGEAPAPVSAPAPAGERALGISVASLRPTAGGSLLDLRLRVDDPALAARALARETKPTLVVERTGARLTVPSVGKAGSLRQTTRNPEQGRIYFALFSNPGLREGDEVTLELGDQRIDHLRIGEGG